jgi:hypothetical protein
MKMLNAKQWDGLANHARTKLVSLLDPAARFVPKGELHASLNVAHKGFYIGIVDAEGEEVARVGFLKDAQNVCDSADMVVTDLCSDLKAKSVPPSKIHTSSVYFTLITDVRYLPDPLAWDEENDGVYFMWGQDYRGLYLPYQIKRMGIPKIRVLDRLCSWEAGVASNLWRLPEGLVWRLACQTHTT